MLKSWLTSLLKNQSYKKSNNQDKIGNGWFRWGDVVYNVYKSIYKIENWIDKTPVLAYNPPRFTGFEKGSMEFIGTEDFVGRNDQLKELHKKLNKNNFVVVTGGSGSGKSSFAIRYVCEYNKMIEDVDFILATNPTDFANAIISRYSDKYPEDEKLNNEKDILKKLHHCYANWLVKDKKGTYGRLVFIWDNLVETENLTEYLPNTKAYKHIQVIITSIPNVPYFKEDRTVNLDYLSEDENLEIMKKEAKDLKSKVEEEETTARQIIDYLGNNTKGVVFVGNSLSYAPIGLKLLWEDIQKKGLEHSALATSLKNNKEENLTDTLQVIYGYFIDQYSSKKESIVDFLLLLSLYAPSGFDFEKLILPTLKKLNSTIDRDVWGYYLGIFKQQKWVESTNRLHQITRDFLTTKLKNYPEEKKIAIQKAFAGVLVVEAEKIKKQSNITQDKIIEYSAFTTHLIKLAETAETLTIENYQDYFSNVEDIVVPNHTLGKIYHAQGSWVAATDYHKKAMKLAYKFLDPNSLRFILIVDQLAGSYLRIFEYNKREIQVLEEIQIILKQFIDKQAEVDRKNGEEKLEYTGILGNLAIVYCTLGLYSDVKFYNNAKTLFVQIIEIREDLLLDEKLPKHDTLNSLGIVYNNFANLHKDTEEHQEAEKYYTKAIETKQEAIIELQKLNNINDKRYNKGFILCYFNFAKLYFDARNTEKGKKWFENLEKSEFNYKKVAWGYLQESLKSAKEFLTKQHSRNDRVEELIKEMQEAGWDKA